MTASKIDVLVVDDSAVVRQVLKKILDAASDIGGVMTARDPIRALELMEKSWPDVIVLDLEMPRMDGLTFLRKLMRERPTPVIICSAITSKQSGAAMTALRQGAVEVIEKPQAGVRGFITGAAGRFVESVRAAAQANLNVVRMSHEPRIGTVSSMKRPFKGRRVCNYSVVAIGSSTGGPNALEAIIQPLTPNSPGVVVVQHMPEHFTEVLAHLLNQKSSATVKEAQTGDVVTRGSVLIAPGGRHMVVEKNDNQLKVAIKDAPPVNRHRPSVDVLLRSVAKVVGGNALGIILTGMGKDGAAGLLAMRKTGALTMAQHEKSCVVYGMPAAAKRIGAVEIEASLETIANEILSGQQKAA